MNLNSCPIHPYNDLDESLWTGIVSESALMIMSSPIIKGVAEGRGWWIINLPVGRIRIKIPISRMDCSGHPHHLFMISDATAGVFPLNAIP